MHRQIDHSYALLRDLCTRLSAEAKDPDVKDLAKVLYDVAEAELQFRDSDMQELEHRLTQDSEGRR